VTPDEYCDTIRGIAFDRETTKAAFEAGRAAEAAERDQELTIAYLDGHARGRDALRRELETQKPVVWYWTHAEDHEMHCPDGLTVWDGAGPNADVEALGAQRGRKVVRLYARPVPPPDVRELVKAADAVVNRWDSPLWSQQGHTGEFIARLRAALARHRGQS